MEAISSKEVIEELRKQWKILWRERIDDRVRAEGVANKDYDLLFVDKGTVIFATRDFKPLDLKEILQLHSVVDVDRVVPPSPSVGGWGKFIRSMIVTQKAGKRVRRAASYLVEEKKKQPLKKGGRGWLHV
ncbi:MAG: hypothetical protein QXV21_05415 [Candidatus Bathyarchaeia archaeon]